MQKLTKIYLWIFYLLPAALFFSYYPIFSIGSSDSMHFELSIPLIWLVIFDCFSVFFILKKRFYRHLKSIWFLLLALFPLYLTLSILWSANVTRAILTAGIVWLIYLAIFSIIYVVRPLAKDTATFRQNIIKAIIIPTIFVSLWCWLQCILDLFSVAQSTTLLCNGCMSTSFGFPHPNGFAIEPQFMGNLLLAPTLLVLYLWLKKPSWKLLALLLFFAATLFLTFSRGAIYAFAIAVVFMLVAMIIRRKSAKPLLALPVLIIAFCFTLNAQGIMAQVSYTTDTYASGVVKSLDQLTLGIFDLAPQTTTSPSQDAALVITDEPAPVEANFSGYVEESTNFRMYLSESALQLWSSSASTILFGVGLGGAGVALHEAGYLGSSLEIVQNEYISLLLETGLVGLALFVLTIIIIIYMLRKQPLSILLYSLLIAFFITLLFFSGLPNALHIYLLPAFFYQPKPSKKSP